MDRENELKRTIEMKLNKRQFQHCKKNSILQTSPLRLFYPIADFFRSFYNVIKNDSL